MGGKAIQGRDTQLRAFRNGNLVQVHEILNFNFKQDADFRRSEYIGTNEPVGDISHKGWSGDLECEVSGPQLDELIDAIIEENLGRVDVEDIHFQYVEYYRDGSKAGWIYSGVQMKYSVGASSRDETVRKKLDWQSNTRKRIF